MSSAAVSDSILACNKSCKESNHDKTDLGGNVIHLVLVSGEVRAFSIASINIFVIIINSSFVLNGCCFGFGFFSSSNDGSATCPPAAYPLALLFSGCRGCSCSTGVDNPNSAGDFEGAPDNSSFTSPAGGCTGASDSEGGISAVAACRLYACNWG